MFGIRTRINQFIDKLSRALARKPFFLRAIKDDHAFLSKAFHRNANHNNGVLYDFLLFKNFEEICSDLNIHLAGKTVLELGASQRPFLPALFLLKGAQQFYANNIFDPHDYFTADEFEAFKLILGLRGSVDDETIKRLFRHTESKFQLSPDHFTKVCPVGAEAIGLPDESIDFLFSFTVFEHVQQPREVIEKSFRLLKPGGWSVDFTDLRDHKHFGKPFQFLTETLEAYTQRTGGSENRLRASDFEALFDA